MQTFNQRKLQGAVWAQPSAAARVSFSSVAANNLQPGNLKAPIAIACALLCFYVAPAYSQVSQARAQTVQATQVAQAVQQAAGTVQASEDAGAEARLGEVTVSADSEPAADMATPVLLLDKEALRSRQAATLGETLAGEPGIRASQFGAGASRPVIRGMDGARVSILADGSELQDASSTSPDHAVTSEPLLARQIEVLRGPSALLYNGGGTGGVVNVLDDKIATRMPERAWQGAAQVEAGTGAGERSGNLSLTGAIPLNGGANGGLVIHAEGLARNADDYRVGKGWNYEGQSLGRVPGSSSETRTGSLGLSWVGNQGYLGLAYTRQTANYGLPGHQHGVESCHPHGDHLHCGGHGDHGHADEHADHDHDEHEHGSVPRVVLASDRWDVRGQWNNPVAGIAAVRLRGGLTNYRHDEVEDGAIATTFKNRAHDLRLEAEHQPIAGWRGTLGVQTSNRRFSAEGEEAYVQPTETQRQSLYLLEELRQGNWRWQAALRHDRQRVTALQSDERRSHHATALSLGSSWNFTPGYNLNASLTSGARLPTAEQMFAHGLHLATATYELGNANLKRERAQSLDLGLAKTMGETTWSLNAYHYRMKDFIYGNTLDAVDGLQLLQYSQANARFTGWEAQLTQKLNRNLALTVFGDGVRARLQDGSPLPRIPALRWGLRANANWQAWQAQVEWAQVLKQNRVAEYETSTPGYGMLNLYASYTLRNTGGPQGTVWQLYVKGQNLTNRLAYSNTSFIKTAAPLMGRNLVVGMRMDF